VEEGDEGEEDEAPTHTFEMWTSTTGESHASMASRSAYE